MAKWHQASKATPLALSLARRGVPVVIKHGLDGTSFDVATLSDPWGSHTFFCVCVSLSEMCVLFLTLLLLCLLLLL